MKRIALVALIALSGLCSILAAPPKEWRMPKQTVVPESLDLRAEEIEAARRIFVPIETCWATK